MEEVADGATLAPTLSETTESAPTSADDMAESAATNLLISKRQVFGHAPLHVPEGHTSLQGALDWRTGTWWHQPPPTTTPTLMRTTITTDTDEHRLTSTTKEEARPVSKTSLNNQSSSRQRLEEWYGPLRAGRRARGALRGTVVRTSSMATCDNAAAHRRRSQRGGTHGLLDQSSCRYCLQSSAPQMRATIHVISLSYPIPIPSLSHPYPIPILSLSYPYPIPIPSLSHPYPIPRASRSCPVPSLPLSPHALSLTLSLSLSLSPPHPIPIPSPSHPYPTSLSHPYPIPIPSLPHPYPIPTPALSQPYLIPIPALS